MTDALEKAVSHFAAKKNSRLDIPEWGFPVYYTPLGLTARQKAVSGLNGPEDTAFRQATLVAEHARDESGKPLFGEATAPTIAKLQNEVDPVVIDRIASAIVGTVSEAHAAKN